MSSYVTRKTPGDTAWFTRDRFGMFIHWGLYSMPARHEWVKTREMIPEEKYDKYFKYFDPDLFDARAWAREAKAAGMKYAVLTTKHHEGFCMFDSKYTDYKCTNTPAGRDLVREYVDAFRAEGLHVGFYYSLIDWHHPDFPIDMLHPRREDPDAYEQSKNRDMHKYAEYMRNQVTELLTNYGKIDVLWFDFSYSGNNGTGDKACLKGWVRHKETGELVTWEACQTFSGSWGYYRDEQTWKSPEMLIRMLVNTVALGGNLLMNVGPTSRGEFDYRAKDALKVYADWMHGNARSIYNCTMAEPEFKAPADCRYTQSVDGKRLYLHLFAYPFAHIALDGLAGKVDYAQFLHDGSEVKFTEGKVEHFSAEAKANPDQLILELPPVKPNSLVPVIELFLK